MTHLSGKQRAASMQRDRSPRLSCQPYSSMWARSRPVPQLPGKYYLSDLPRLPPMPDNKERTAKPTTGHLVQQMPNRAYRQRDTTPRDTAVSSTTDLPVCRNARRQTGGLNRSRIRPCPLRHAEAAGTPMRMPCEHGQVDVCCRPWTYSRHPFCQDENARSCRDFAQVTGIIDDSGRAIQA